MKGVHFVRILAMNIRTGKDMMFCNIWEASAALKISVSWLRQLIKTGNASSDGWTIDYL